MSKNLRICGNLFLNCNYYNMNWIKVSLIIFIFLLTGKITAFAQQQNVVINADTMINKLVEKRIQINKKKGTIPGYRVQIYFGSQRSDANDAKTKFNTLFPNIDCYLIYQQPYFKVRAGDFRTRLEATNLDRKIVKEFNSVFIVEDEINLPRLNQ
jgi:hypothetical protein